MEIMILLKIRIENVVVCFSSQVALKILEAALN